MEDIEELKKKQDQQFNVIVKNREMLQINEKEIKELKESITIVADNSGNFEDMLLSKTNKNREVLRNILKEFEENHDDSIHRNFFTGQLEKLDQKDEIYKCGKSYKQHFIDDSYKTCEYLKDGEDNITELQTDPEWKKARQEYFENKSFYESSDSIKVEDEKEKEPTPSKPQVWKGEIPLVYANEKRGDFDRKQKESTDDWNVIIVKRRCPHKCHEMHDSKWSEACELTRKGCNIENCPKKYLGRKND